MKIHKTVNPVAYENTYFLEGEKHLIVVDPGSHWEAIRQTIENINKPICAILLTHAHYDPYHESGLGSRDFWQSSCLYRRE